MPGDRHDANVDLVKKVEELENQIEAFRKALYDGDRTIIKEHVSSDDGLSYNYFDEMAQSYCAASHKFFTFAIRRDCQGIAPTCNDICKSAEKEILSRTYNQRDNVGCYDAFYVKKGHPRLKANPGNNQPDAALVNMETYGYGTGGCTWTPNHCGPNYCCCKAY